MEPERLASGWLKNFLAGAAPLQKQDDGFVPVRKMRELNYYLLHQKTGASWWRRW